MMKTPGLTSISVAGIMLYLLAVLAFGIIQVSAGAFLKGLLPAPGRFGLNPFLVITVSLLMIIPVILVLWPTTRITGAAAIAILFLILFLLIHVPKLFSNIYDPNEWTAAGEVIAIFSGACYLLSILFENTGKLPGITGLIRRVSWYLFACTLVIFFVLHIKYNDFIITLIPAWLPGKLIFGYLVIVAFFSAALSLVIQKYCRLAMSMLAAMFLTWVLILHGPRVISNPGIEAEWTSMFVAVCMAGICLMMAGSPLIRKSKSTA